MRPTLPDTVNQGNPVVHRNGGSLRILLGTMAYTVALFILSTMPGSAEVPSWQGFLTVSPTIQNLGHLPAYALLVVLWFGTLQRYLRPRDRALFAAGALAFLYGALLELMQMAVPGRYPSLSDCLMNLIGIALVMSYHLLAADPPLAGEGSDAGPVRS